MPTARVNGTSIYYRQAGEGPDLVLVHGLAGDHAHWYLRLLPLLAGDFRVTVYDLRGHGLSAVPTTGYSSVEMAADLEGLLDRLRTNGAHVVGHSFGGVIALQLARLRPTLVHSLTIADSRIDVLQPARRASSWPGWGAWQSRLRARGLQFEDDPELDYRIIEHLAPRLGGRSLQRWRQLLATTNARAELGMRSGITRAALAAIGQPTNLIYGELSFCLPTGRILATTMPRARLVVLPGLGHFHPITSPHTLVAQIRSFLGGDRED
jgi:pimeloyl-ACP methyl ester carboxylesterase